MSTQILESFPPGVAQKLEHYVYRLYDPRNGETFYVGKGSGDRIFAHMRGVREIDENGLDDLKFKRIIEIRNKGFEVGHVIHRHGMDSATALQVEAALIDAYPGLTNKQGGHGSNDYGCMHAHEVVERYCAPIADFSQHKVLLISVNRSAEETDLYEAVRYAWKVNVSKAEKAEVILATQLGMIKDTFVVDMWEEATIENFPGKPAVEGRYGFHGKVASEEVRQMYKGKQVPPEYRKRGAANPIKYSWN